MGNTCCTNEDAITLKTMPLRKESEKREIKEKYEEE